MKSHLDLGIHLTGSLNGWATPKDLILHIAGKLTVRVSISIIMPCKWDSVTDTIWRASLVPACVASGGDWTYTRIFRAWGRIAILHRIGNNL